MTMNTDMHIFWYSILTMCTQLSSKTLALHVLGLICIKIEINLSILLI